MMGWMRVFRIAKLYGQSPESVAEWDAETFARAEALETYIMAEQQKAIEFTKQRRR